MRWTLILLFLSCIVQGSAQGVKSFKLQNGLTVFVWEDHTQPDIFGMVTVKTGSVNDPAEYTGLAHYLEHLMFKGTTQLGALDWNREEEIYREIISLYDARAAAAGPAAVKEIDMEINRLTNEQSVLSVQNEFSTLTESIGGTGLNAGTSYDYTLYYNSFPKNQLEKWLELNSVRFINPVFRSFQNELETVYEEYNMYADNPSAQTSNFILEQAFPGHPYARPIIGTGEHLKNPSISRLTEFYNTWYVASNMALVLIGDIKTEEVARLVSQKFSRIPGGAVPERKPEPLQPVSGKKQITGKVGQFPRTVLVFNGVPTGHRDKIVLDVVAEMLSNRNRSGLLDKLSLDGDVMSASASLAAFAREGRFMIDAVPAFDMNQRVFESHRKVEKLLLDQLQLLSAGKADEWLLDAVKSNMIKTFSLRMESPAEKANLLAEGFIAGQPINELLDYESAIMAVTPGDVNRVIGEYLAGNYLSIQITEGKAAKGATLEKPGFKQPAGKPGVSESAYASWFRKIQVPMLQPDFADFGDVIIRPVNEKSRLFYHPNEVNDVFTMTLKYGVGERELPRLGMATQLMNSAGVMAAFDPREFRSALSQLNAICSYSSDDDYTYVRVEGTEENLELICRLITRQILMPRLDEKQLNGIKGRTLQSRRIEKENPDALQDALSQYIRYGDRSDYLNRLSESDILKLTISDLTTEFQRATDFATEVHFTGNPSFRKSVRHPQ
jgi:zinc protease